LAGFEAIAVTSRAILGLIEDARLAEFERSRFRLFQSVDMDSPREGFAEGISLYLYRVTFNTTRRNMPPRRDPITGNRRRPPVPLDLHFLLTAWAPDAGQQQRLLGWAVRTLEDTPILPAGFLNRFAPGGQDVFEPSETVELVGETLTLQDLENIWEVAKARQQPSLGYVARQVAIDSTLGSTEDRGSTEGRPVEFTDGRPVQTREFGTGTLLPV
jgi:Pvc16 N-terminal domain